jgi:phosphatidate cytidylyltransferase
MLVQRVITATALLTALLLIVFFTSSEFFILIFSLVVLLAGWEWTQLSGIRNISLRCLYCAVLIVLCYLSYLIRQEYLLSLLTLSMLFWAIALVLVCSYPRLNNYWNNPFSLALMGILVLLPCWLVLLYLRELDDFEFYFLALIILVAAADSGAYFSGRRFGKHKLAEQVSPNKTWEGVIGGALSCLILMLVAKGFVQTENISWLSVFLLPMLVSFFSVTGDLFESMLKRVRDLKDSGKILPGHGGILDRIDGIVSTAPAYVLVMFYLS